MAAADNTKFVPGTTARLGDAEMRLQACASGSAWRSRGSLPPAVHGFEDALGAAWAPLAAVGLPA